MTAQMKRGKHKLGVCFIWVRSGFLYHESQIYRVRVYQMSSLDRAAIFAAFESIPRPEAEEIGLSGSNVYDSIERRGVIEFFSRHASNQLSGALLQTYPHAAGAALYFMSEKAIAYFLPAYLAICVDDE